MSRPARTVLMPTLLSLAGLCWAGVIAAAEDSRIFGHVELVQGTVTVQSPDGQTVSPQVGDEIETGSTLITGADGELHVATKDSGYVALRANTRLRLDAYRAEGGDDDHLALSLLKGTFRAITGWIGHFNRDEYKITTPTATIGIRGTDHEPAFVAPEDAAALGEAAGTYDKVNDGGSYIQTGAGRVDIAPSQSGFASREGQASPQLLDHVPHFYRATRNEGRINRRRDMLRRQMPARHQARNTQWKKQHPKPATVARAKAHRRKMPPAEHRKRDRPHPKKPDRSNS
jgi:hypothetical protein